MLPSMIITAHQCRMARAAVGWSNQRLAKAAGVGPNTVSLLETGKADPRASTLRKLVAAFEAEGIEFIEDGVLYRPGD